jgi:acetyltransferase-like isoleucine patch superfamily enzyme
MAFLTRNQLKKIGFRKVGKNVLISEKASIYGAERISFGNNCRVDDFAILSAGKGGIEIGDYVHIACFATLIGGGKITMSNYSGISARVTIFSSSDTFEGDFMTGPCLPKSVTNTSHKDVMLGKHVVIGIGSIVLPGTILEDGCAVGAMCLVTKSFSANSIITGVPGKKIRDRQKNIYELEKKLNKK